MENTTENKARFFNLYRGLHVFYLEGLSKSYTHPFDKIMDEDHVSLRSISSLTDEEAIKIAKIEFSVFECTGFEFKVSRNLRENIKVYVLRHNEVVKIVELSFLLLHIESADYLRSIGILIPWMDLSVEQIIQYGWAKEGLK